MAYGRQHLIWGNKSAGKSSFLLQHVARAQKEGKICAWIDVEQSFDRAWSERLGVDNSSLILTRSKTVTKATNDITDLMAAKTDIIVVDSISSLLPSVYFDDKDELKDVENSKQIGAQSRELSIACPMWNYANENTQLILISQQRNQFGTMHASLIPTGGKSILFHSSTIIKLFSSDAEAVQIKDEIAVGDKLYQEVVGRPVNWHIERNKTGPQSRTGQYDFYFDGPTVGVDSIGETLDYAERTGVIVKGGAWYTIYDERFQGRAKAIAYLREHPEVVDKLTGEIVAKIQ